jgi:type IV secretory pathway VirB6-like protein
MNENYDVDKIKSIMTFLIIIFAEAPTIELNYILNMSPDYLWEKFNRYVNNTDPLYLTGMHKNLEDGIFNLYCKKWRLTDG